MQSVFRPHRILLPKDPALLPNWSVVACDQFTSDPAYWQRVADRTAAVPSTAHLILPECGMEQVDQAEKAREIGRTMRAYEESGLFAAYENALILVRRHQNDGSVREGIVGAVDLEAYEYTKGSKPPVRATEETVAARLPARVAMRSAASLELPHLLLLADDAKGLLIEAVSARRSAFEKLYDFELMENGGRIEGYLLDEKAKADFAGALASLSAPEAFAARYGMKNEPVLSLAVGDGNHSLAAAKQLYERRKRESGENSKEAAACRFVLAELNNLHSDALSFSAIHRVVFGVSPAELLAALKAAFADCGLLLDTATDGQYFDVLAGGEKHRITLKKPPHLLSVGSLQNFLDAYLCSHPAARIDYIHGEKETAALAGQENAVGFLLPVMEKKDLFPTVLRYGALPRKTFSMGHANEKRYYLEAARILP